MRLALAALGAFFAFVLPATAAPNQFNTAVLLVNFSDDARQPWSTSYIDSRWDGPVATTNVERNVRDFFQRSSFGQMTSSADVYGWFSLGVSSSQCSNLGVWATAADQAATAAGVNLEAYTNKAYIVPDNANCTFGGTADWPGNRIWVALNTAGCTEGGACQSWFHFPHELGHNLGLDHATSYICTDVSGAHVVLSSACVQAEYGDLNDIMGCCSSGLASNITRLNLGWIPLSQLFTINQTGDYTISPYNDPAGVVYRVADGTGSFIYFENRALGTAYDVGEGFVWPTGNLLVRRAPALGLDGSGHYAKTQLLDCSPADGDANAGQRGCPVGSSFALGNVTVTNLSFDGTSNVVHLEFPSIAQCADGLDNDGDGKVDYPVDKQCRSAADNDEKRR